MARKVVSVRPVRVTNLADPWRFAEIPPGSGWRGFYSSDKSQESGRSQDDGGDAFRRETGVVRLYTGCLIMRSSRTGFPCALEIERTREATPLAHCPGTDESKTAWSFPRDSARRTTHGPHDRFLRLDRKNRTAAVAANDPSASAHRTPTLCVEFCQRKARPRPKAVPDRHRLARGIAVRSHR